MTVGNCLVDSEFGPFFSAEDLGGIKNPNSGGPNLKLAANNQILRGAN